jgi:methylglutaconyl-CoA hydratase
MSELVHLDVGAGRATITLDSPANRNALSAQLRRELREHLDAALADESVRVVVLTHAGPVFCSGMDLRESRGAGAGDQGVQEFPGILTTLWHSPKPVIARLAGPARAGGVGLVAACDIAIGARAGLEISVPPVASLAPGGATFAFSEVRIGVVPAVISVPVVPRLLPRAAEELMLTGETFDADRAAAIGLLNRAVDPDALDSEVTRYADMLARGGPRALAATKAMLRRTPAQDMAADLDAMLRLSAEFFASEEGQEGMTAFAEKRSPAWVPET